MIHSSRTLRPGKMLRTILAVLALGAARSEVLAIVVAPPSIVKSFAAATVPLNGSVTLTFTITNPNGATDLTGVGFNDNLPSGLIVANPDSLVGTCDPGVITLDVTSVNLVGATILAGSSCTFSVDVYATSYGTKVNTTDPVTSNEGGTGNAATASVDVLPPDLTIQKTDSGPFRQGQQGATYTITVTNSGGSGTTAAVTVTDSLPAGLGATGIAGTNWNCTQPAGPCTRSDFLDVGLGYEPITVTVNVANDAPATVTNTATVSGGGETNTANDTASDPTTITGVSLFTMAPCRLVDTRGASGPFGGPALAPGEVRLYAVTGGSCPVPSSATGVAVNLTVVSPAATGLLQIYAGDEAVPGTSTLSFSLGKTRANNALVSLASDGTGQVAVRNASGGTVDVILDVNGYFD